MSSLAFTQTRSVQTRTANIELETLVLVSSRIRRHYHIRSRLGRFVRWGVEPVIQEIRGLSVSAMLPNSDVVKMLRACEDQWRRGMHASVM